MTLPIQFRHLQRASPAVIGDVFLDVLGAEEDRLADPVVGDLPGLRHSIPPLLRHLPVQKPSPGLNHGDEGLLGLVCFRCRRDESGLLHIFCRGRTPGWNRISSRQPPIDVGLQEQRLAPVVLLDRGDFGEKLVLDVLRKAIGVGEFDRGRSGSWRLLRSGRAGDPISPSSTTNARTPAYWIVMMISGKVRRIVG